MEWVNIMVVVFFWSMGFLFLWRVPLPRPSGEPDGRAPRVTVIIPARNEAERIGELLESLNAQAVPGMETIVVDDHSDDATVEIARQAKATVVILADDPPESWRGKPWACWQGANRAAGEILIFLDADTRVERGGLQRIVETFLRLGGLVSIQPYHRMERVYEQLSAYFNVVGMAGINAFTILGRRLKPVGGFGPCNVCGREDYFAVGGHVTAKGAILESLPLGQAFLSTDRPVHCLGGRGNLSFRMYPGGLGSLVEGFGKGFAIGAQAMPLAAFVMVICWITSGMDVTRHLVNSVFSWRGQESSVWLALYVLYSAQLYWMLARIGNFRCLTALLFPVPLVFFVIVFLRSLVDTFLLKRVSWKGRRIDMRRTRGDEK